jgi:hypothetical protein
LRSKNLINVYFESCSVSYCPGVCNRVAHVLAAQGSKYPRDCVLLRYGVPTGVEDLVTSDITVSVS